ncbi:MAG: nucleoside 2-deoxyribosyltransferase domain-containing protein [Candidatus Sericytochromatia bacterium]
MAQIIKPPQVLPVSTPSHRPQIFLAGSIDMGQAEPWQEQVADYFALDDVILLNPRRDDWDASWQQSIDHPAFRQQVEWELDGLTQADHILMYFAPQSKAPITLLELGLMANSGKLHVACPPGFWRRGNVEIVCARFGLTLYDGLTDLLRAFKSKFQQKFALKPEIV